VPVPGMRQALRRACVKHGPFVGSGSVAKAEYAELRTSLNRAD
jgi:hypothetical protein